MKFLRSLDTLVLDRYIKILQQYSFINIEVSDVTVWNLFFESCPQSACNHHNTTQTLHAHRNHQLVKNILALAQCTRDTRWKFGILLTTNIRCPISILNTASKKQHTLFVYFQRVMLPRYTHSKQPGYRIENRKKSHNQNIIKALKDNFTLHRCFVNWLVKSS